jgi:uncharacterized OsmC-like protein
MGSTAFADTIARFTSDPSAGHSTPAVTARLADGRARLAAGPFNWDSDLPPTVGGRNEAPSPTAYLLGALAGCAVAFVTDTLAPQFDVEIDDMTATARCSTDVAGLLGVADADPVLRGITIEIHIASPSPRDRVEAMQEAWLQRCPIYLALRDANPVEVSFS